jgi:hypothetical protein
MTISFKQLQVRLLADGVDQYVGSQRESELYCDGPLSPGGVSLV